MEKSLKNKIVSIISAVALACCTLLAFVVPSFDDQQQTASANARGNSSAYYFGCGSFIGFGTTTTRYVTDVWLQHSPMLCGSTTLYQFNQKTVNVGAMSSMPATGNANYLTAPVGHKYSYKGYCFYQTVSPTNNASQVSSAWNFRSPYPTYASFQYITNSPLVEWTQPNSGGIVPLDTLYEGVYIDSTSTATSLMVIVDFYFSRNDSIMVSNPSNSYRIATIPMTSIRSSAVPTFVSFADIFRIMFGANTNFASFMPDGNKYLFCRVSVGGDSTGIYFGTCSNDNVVYNGNLQITKYVNPDFHYGHIFVDAVNDFTDIEIGKGLSIKFILLIVVGLTLAVALIKMLI